MGAAKASNGRNSAPEYPVPRWRTLDSLVTPDELGNLNDLGMWLDVDGERMQSGNTATLIFKVPQLIAYCSRFMSLQPGDVISTGTPPGVGMGKKPPRDLKRGEVVTLGIAVLGQQTSTVLPARPA